MLNSKFSPSISTVKVSPTSSFGATSLEFNLFKAPAKNFILAPSTGPNTLKFGFKLKFIYSPKSLANTTSLTLSSSFIRSTTSLIVSLNLPSTNTFCIGWRTFILVASLDALPKVTKFLTKSIFSSNSGFINSKLAFG